MCRRTAAVLTSVVAVFILTTSGAAWAELPRSAGSVYGGQVDISNRGALSVGMGWPSMFVRWDFSTSGRFGVGLKVDFLYGHPIGVFHHGIGLGFDVPMRIQVFDRQNWAIALSLTPGLFTGFEEQWAYHHYWHDDAVMVGPHFDFGAIASVEVRPFLRIHFGMRMGFNFLVYAWDHHHTTWDFYVPIVPFAGMELQVHRMIAVFVLMQAGPAIRSGYHCYDWDRRDETCRYWDRDIGAVFSGKFQFGATFFF